MPAVARLVRLEEQLVASQQMRGSSTRPVIAQPAAARGGVMNGMAPSSHSRRTMQQVPLTKRQLKDWIADGVLVLPINDFPADFHMGMFKRAEELHSHNQALMAPIQAIEDREERTAAMRKLASESQNVRKQIVRELPELTDIVRSPTLSGALHSILGPGYAMHPHRALHTANPHGDQQFHKDGHHLPMRSHRPRFIMAMYYPAAVSEDMGPTSVIPRTQYWTVDRRGFTQNEERLDPSMTPPLDADGWAEANDQMNNAMNSDDLSIRDARLAAAVQLMGGGVHEQKMVTVQPGSVCFIHFDIFHRGSRSIQGASFRPMVKLQFFRTSDPEPAGDPIDVSDSFAYTGAGRNQTAIWENVLNHLQGGTTENLPRDNTDDTAAMLTDLLSKTTDGVDYRTEEPKRIGAAYQMAPHTAHDSQLIKQIIRGLRYGEEYTQRACMFALGASGEAAVPSLLEVMATDDLDTATFAVHALADAVRTPDTVVIAAVATLIARAEDAIEERTKEMKHKWNGTSDAHNATGIDMEMSVMLKTRSTCVQALAPLAQRAVALGLTEAATKIAQLLCDIVEAGEVAQAAPTYLKKGGAAELASMAMLSLVTDSRSEPLICAPNDLTGWTDPRFNNGILAAALVRLQKAMATEPSAVQEAVNAVLMDRLAAPTLAHKMSEVDLIETDESYSGAPLYLPPMQ